MSDFKICGRNATTIPPKPSHGPKYAAPLKAQRRPYSKIVVEGVNHRSHSPEHPKPIRFRSRENAERHIRNLGLEVDA